ncbi:MAG: carboxypeptidase-like regulatory domain-containing protein, partial [Myxococcota bacterium]
MRLDRSQLVLAAALGFAVLAGVEASRRGAGVAVPGEEAGQAVAPVAAAPPISAVPPEPLARALPALLVEGRITNPHGGPVPGARVSRVGGRGSDGTSDASGSYALRVEWREGDAPALRFSASGYEEAVVALEATESDERLWL